MLVLLVLLSSVLLLLDAYFGLKCNTYRHGSAVAAYTLPKRPGWIVGWTSQSVGEGRAGKEGGEHEENGRYVQDGR